MEAVRVLGEKQQGTEYETLSKSGSSQLLRLQLMCSFVPYSLLPGLSLSVLLCLSPRSLQPPQILSLLAFSLCHL